MAYRGSLYGVSLTSRRRTIYAPSWERVFSLVGLQFFPLGVAKMTTINVVFYNNGSYYAIKFLPNEVEVLIFWEADMCPKVGKASEKWLLYVFWGLWEKGIWCFLYLFWSLSIIGVALLKYCNLLIDNILTSPLPIKIVSVSNLS